MASGKTGVPELSESEEITLFQYLGKIQGLVESSLTKSKEFHDIILGGLHQSINTIESIDLPVMSAKNNLKFHGKADESAEDLIKSIELLRLANGWDEKKTLGNVLVTLQDEARLWYEQQPAGFFGPARAADAAPEDPPPDPTFAVFKEKFLEKFKEDKSPGDIMFEVLKHKQTRGQSVDDYITAIHPKLTKVKNLTEDMRVSLVINGFLPVIQDQLRLKDTHTMKDLELWARRIEKMNFVQKSAASVNSLDYDDATDYSGASGQNYAEGEVNAFYDQHVQNRTGHFQNRGSHNNSMGPRKGGKWSPLDVKQGHFPNGQSFPHAQPKGRNLKCWICQGNHMKRNCPRRGEFRARRGALN